MSDEKGKNHLLFFNNEICKDMKHLLVNLEEIERLTRPGIMLRYSE